jgi:hypothetical protein
VLIGNTFLVTLTLNVGLGKTNEQANVARILYAAGYTPDVGRLVNESWVDFCSIEQRLEI